jgi:hypothetical protein
MRGDGPGMMIRCLWCVRFPVYPPSSSFFPVLLHLHSLPCLVSLASRYSLSLRVPGLVWFREMRVTAGCPRLRSTERQWRRGKGGYGGKGDLIKGRTKEERRTREAFHFSGDACLSFNPASGPYTGQEQTQYILSGMVTVQVFCGIFLCPGYSTPVRTARFARTDMKQGLHIFFIIVLGELGTWRTWRS